MVFFSFGFVCQGLIALTCSLEHLCGALLLILELQGAFCVMCVRVCCFAGSCSFYYSFLLRHTSSFFQGTYVGRVHSFRLVLPVCAPRPSFSRVCLVTSFGTIYYPTYMHFTLINVFSMRSMHSWLFEAKNRVAFSSVLACAARLDCDELPLERMALVLLSFFGGTRIFVAWFAAGHCFVHSILVFLVGTHVGDGNRSIWALNLR